MPQNANTAQGLIGVGLTVLSQQLMMGKIELRAPMEYR
jgi:hypothetical protein